MASAAIYVVPGYFLGDKEKQVKLAIFLDEKDLEAIDILGGEYDYALNTQQLDEPKYKMLYDYLYQTEGNQHVCDSCETIEDYEQYMKNLKGEKGKNNENIDRSRNKVTCKRRSNKPICKRKSK